LVEASGVVRLHIEDPHAKLACGTPLLKKHLKRVVTFDQPEGPTLNGISVQRVWFLPDGGKAFEFYAVTVVEVGYPPVVADECLQGARPLAVNS
jgi:hypothetical protein